MAIACNDCGNIMKGFATTCSRCGKKNLTLTTADTGDSGSTSSSSAINDWSNSALSSALSGSAGQSAWSDSAGDSKSAKVYKRSSGSSTESKSSKGSPGDEPTEAKKPNWSARYVEKPFAGSHPGAETKTKPAERPAGLGTLLFGFIVPSAAIVFETQTHLCAQSFFDPFPSITHILFFSLIPLTSFMAWMAARRDMSSMAGVMALFSGMAMGVAFLYSLMFLPMAPLSVLLIFMLGLGLLGLSPMLSIPCIWKSGKVACSLAESATSYADPQQLKHVGHVFILIMVVALELPSTLTRIHLAEAADSRPEVSREAVKWLRAFGSEEVLLRACYERSGRATDIIGSLYESTHPMNIETVKDVFYKVTGKPFNTVPIPVSARATIQHAGIMNDPSDLNVGVEDEFDYDADIAGEIVSGVARGLSISASRITGALDPDGALANVEWQFTLSNKSKYDREARAKILLPPNAVVNRATLTVNGEERDATIMGRSQARAIYKRAVVEKKDPLLVSMCGQDLLLVQCFPVRPSDTMVVKLYMVAPMQLAQSDMAELVLPSFDERNFQIDVGHQVEFTSKTSLVTSNGKGMSGKSEAAGSSIRGTVDTAILARGEAMLSAPRNPKFLTARSSSDRDGPMAGAHLSLRPQAYEAPKTLTVLIDGSAGMAPFFPQVVKAIADLPASISKSYVVVKDEALTVSDASALANIQCQGGQDNSKALLASLRQAKRAGSAVLWIHAAQPVCHKTIKPQLKYALDVSEAPHVLYDMQVVSSANEILDGIQDTSKIVRVYHTGSPQADLNRLITSWGPQNPDLDPARGEELQAVTFSSMSDLAAYYDVLASIAKGDEARAASLAVVQHLVTPVTSAVVTMDLPARNPAPVSIAPKGLRYRDGINGLGSLGSFGKVGDAFSGERESSASNQKGADEEKMISSLPQRANQSAAPKAAARGGSLASNNESKKEDFSLDSKARASDGPRELDGLSKQKAGALSQDSENAQSLVEGSETTDDTGTAASVPESDTWLLLAAVAALLSAAVYLKKRGVAVRA